MKFNTIIMNTIQIKSLNERSQKIGYMCKRMIMSKVKLNTSTFRKISIATAAVIIVLVILDLLMTRQILPYGTASASIVEIVLFVLTVILFMV